MPSRHQLRPLRAALTSPQPYPYDYRRTAFGEASDNGGPCDTRDEILNRDLIEVTHVSTKRCPDAVATGTLNDPLTLVGVDIIDDEIAARGT